MLVVGLERKDTEKDSEEYRKIFTFWNESAQSYYCKIRSEKTYISCGFHYKSNDAQEQCLDFEDPNFLHLPFLHLAVSGDTSIIVSMLPIKCKIIADLKTFISIIVACLFMAMFEISRHNLLWFCMSIHIFAFHFEIKNSLFLFHTVLIPALFFPFYGVAAVHCAQIDRNF